MPSRTSDSLALCIAQQQHIRKPVNRKGRIFFPHVLPSLLDLGFAKLTVLNSRPFGRADPKTRVASSDDNGTSWIASWRRSKCCADLPVLSEKLCCAQAMLTAAMKDVQEHIKPAEMELPMDTLYAARLEVKSLL